jgi:hypothetical protein
VSAVGFDYHALATLRGICSTYSIRESGGVLPDAPERAMTVIRDFIVR